MRDESFERVQQLRYSAVIRSVGQNPLLNQLLESLSVQSLKPAEIVIILPQGMPAWDTQHSSLIRFAHSARGMITQRTKGIQEAYCPYLLLLDDDIVFRNTRAIERLFVAMLQYNAQGVIPFSPDAFPKGKRRLIYALFGLAVPTSKRHLGYTPGGGFYYPRRPSFEQPYEVEGGRGCCIAVDGDFVKKAKVIGDPDLEKVAYPLREDGAFVLDIVRHGGQAILVGDVPYEHLGGARKLTPQHLFQFYEASVFNNYIFWRKYIRGHYRTRIVPTAAFSWLLTGIFVFALLSSAHHKSVQPLRGALRGFVKIIQSLRRGRQL